MSAEIRIPSLGVGMTEGTLTEWLATDGQVVQVGDPLYALETDKSVQEIESTAAGTLRIVVQPGEIQQVGDLIGHIE